MGVLGTQGPLDGGAGTDPEPSQMGVLGQTPSPPRWGCWGGARGPPEGGAGHPRPLRRGCWASFLQGLICLLAPVSSRGLLPQQSLHSDVDNSV